MYISKPLPYEYNALEPFISSDTLHYHHDKHYQKYVDSVNKVLENNPYDPSYSFEDLVTHIDTFPIAERGKLLFNLGGVLNHELYFASMGKENHVPVGMLKQKIEEDFGSIDNFTKTYMEEANKLTGSGYTFLVVNKEKNLEIISTSNQDTPISYGLYPIMALDLWEHAYYLDYQNRRDEYIKNFFQIVNYENVDQEYAKAQKTL